MVTKPDPPPFPSWLAEQLPFERHLVELSDGVKIHVMEQGEGRPVFMFHGSPTWGYLYRKVALELSGEPFRVIMPDLVGLGFSDRVPMSQLTLANQVRWMGELVGLYETEDAIAVVQDWGGAIGLHAMSQHPGLTTGIVVMNTIVGPPKPGFKPTTFHRFFSSSAGPLVSKYLGYPQRKLSFAQGDKKSIGRAEQNAYNYALRARDDYKFVIGFVRMVPDTMEHAAVPILGEVAKFVSNYEGNAAIVWGEKDPVLGKVRRRIERAFPQAVSTVTQAGHFLQEEVPVEIANAVRAV